MHRIANDSGALLARFAQAIDQFDQATGWWARLQAMRERDEQLLDLKKSGTFPIVHGVRALALQHRLHQLATRERIAVLADRGVLDAALARDLVDALHCLMGIKLQHNLRQRSAGHTTDNLVRLSGFGTLERDAVRDSLTIVRRFKLFLHQHFGIDHL
jgi:CBS domain-containing protein